MTEASPSDTPLAEAVHALQTDYTHGARELATSALTHLSEIVTVANAHISAQQELWAFIRRAAKELCGARPALSAAITAVLLRALDGVQQECDQNGYTHLEKTAKSVLDTIVRQRDNGLDELGGKFADWLSSMLSEEKESTKILTLSNSSTIRSAILQSLKHPSNLGIHLTVLESRPRFEGASMAAALLQSAASFGAESRLTVTMAPDCAVGTLAKDGDVVLLGADRISSTGAVSNKIGSLAAAVCAKALNPRSRVVVVSDIDKIVKPGAEEHVEEHPAIEVTEAWPENANKETKSERVKVFGEWFEWVSEDFIDLYVTERGIFNREDIKCLSKEVTELENRFFQGL